MFKQSDSKTTVNVLEKCLPEIVISKDALIKMRIYTDECDKEIGWLGTAYKIKDNDGEYIYVDDVFLFKQDVHSTTTEITTEGLSDFAENLIQQENGIEIWNNMKLWGHSHVNMSTYASKQDDDQMETFKECDFDWFIRIIANKKEEIKVDLYNYKQGIIYNNIPWQEAMSKEEENLYIQIRELQNKLEELNSTIYKKYEEEIKEEIEKKVNNKIVVRYITNTKNKKNTYYRGYYNDYYNDYDNLDTCYKKNDYYLTHETITNSEEVRKYFEEEVIVEIGKLKTFYDVKTYLNSYDDFTNAEITIIWETGKEAVKESKGGMVK